MEFKRYENSAYTVCELLGEGRLVSTTQDALDLMGEAGARGIVVREDQVHPDFFRLRTGLAGEMLQKFTNYGIGFAIIGDFAKYTSKPLRDFIYESNRTGQVLFVSSIEEALAAWASNV